VFVPYFIIAVTENYIAMTTWIQWIDSSGTENVQGTISAIVWWHQEKTRKFSDIFVAIVDGI